MPKLDSCCQVVKHDWSGACALVVFGARVVVGSGCSRAVVDTRTPWKGVFFVSGITPSTVPLQVDKSGVSRQHKFSAYHKGGATNKSDPDSKRTPSEILPGSSGVNLLQVAQDFCDFPFWF